MRGFMEMKCIMHNCEQEATHTLHIMEEETAPLGDGTAALHVWPQEIDKAGIPYCDLHTKEQKEKFKYFKYTVFREMKK